MKKGSGKTHYCKYCNKALPYRSYSLCEACKIVEEKHFCNQCGEYLFSISKRRDKAPKNSNFEIRNADRCVNCTNSNIERCGSDRAPYSNEYRKEKAIAHKQDKIEFKLALKEAKKRKREAYAISAEKQRKIDNGTFNFKQSDRMKLNNPMKNSETVNKVSSTLREGYDSGRISKHYGKDHWNYKGNRRFNSAVRDKLVDWRFNVLKRDNFTCRDCCSTKNLQVHHVRSLKEIMTFVLESLFNVEYANAQFDSTVYENFQDMVDATIREHSLEDGITYCKFCHEKHDYQYRIFKGVLKQK